MQSIFKTISHIFVFAAIFLLLILFGANAPLAFASGNTCTWTGLGGNSNFSSSANWTGCGGGIPTNGDSLVFDVASTSDSSFDQINNDIPNLSVQKVTFSGLTTKWLGTAIAGNELTINSAIDVTQHSSDPNLNIKFLSMVKLGGDVTITGSNLHNFMFDNRLNLNEHTLTYNDTGDLSLAGNVVGNGNIVANHYMFFNDQPVTCDQNGQNCVTSPNTWTGNLTVAANTSVDVYPGSLGNNASSVTIANGGHITLWNFKGGALPQNITLGGSGYGTTTDIYELGALFAIGYCNGPSCGQFPNPDSNVTLTGKITLTSNTGLRSGGVMTITGPIVGAHTITFINDNIPQSALVICSSNNQSLTPNSPSCKIKNSLPQSMVVSGTLVDSSQNPIRETNFTISCNGQSKNALSSDTGFFRVVFNKSCTIGSTINITVNLGVPFLPGSKETGSGIVLANGSIGTILLTFIPPVSAKAQLALDWAKKQVDQLNGPVEMYEGINTIMMWNENCLPFVADAWTAAGVNIGAAADPATYWKTNPKNYVELPETNYTDSPPPAGALVFWNEHVINKITYPSHVALSLGNGTAYSTPAAPSTSKKVFILTLSDRDPITYKYLGWILPQ